MIIPVIGPGTLHEYIKSGEPEAPRPRICPKCEAKESFWRHDHFQRVAVEGDLAMRIRIQRFLCHDCGIVASCIFAFLVPYRQATAAVIAQAVRDYATTETTYRQEAEELSALDSSGPPKPSHCQVFRWVQGVSNKVRQLLLHAQKELVMRGRSDEVQGLIHGGCPNAGKAHTRAKASLLNELAEFVQLARLLVGEDRLPSLHAHFLSQVESLQSIFSDRSLRLANPQSMKHMIF